MGDECKVHKEKVARNHIAACAVGIAVAIGLISIAIGIDKANGVKSVYNYPNAVIVDKGTQHSKKLTRRVKTSPENGYTIKTIRVPHGEYVEFNIGDTIKCH